MDERGMPAVEHTERHPSFAQSGNHWFREPILTADGP